MKKFYSMPLLFCAILLLTLVVSCGRKEETHYALKPEQVAVDKQKIKLVFAKAAYEEQSKISVSNAGISGNVGSYAVTSPIGIGKFREAAPFVGIYGFWEGKQTDAGNVTLEISESSDGKSWSNWIATHADPDAEATGDRKAFAPLELNKAIQFVRLRVRFTGNNAQVKNAMLYFFNPGVTPADEQRAIDQAAEAVRIELGQIKNPGARVTAAALCAKPGFTSRATWGARAAKSTPSLTTVNFLIVHHENGSNTSTDWAARVRSIQNYHMDVNGWGDIGYNYLVDPNGVAYEGRGGGENVTGAHFCGKNQNTMGVCMMGNFINAKPTNNAEYALKRIMAWKAKQRGINVLGTAYHVNGTINRLTGHRAGCATECPGAALWNDLSRLRNDVKTNFIDKCN